VSDSPWQSPSGSGAEPAAGGFGGPPPAAGGFGGPPPPASPVGGAAWTPPPRPGLIPLAPLGLGAILGGSFRVLRRNPRPVVGFSLVIHAIIGVLTIVVTGFLTVSVFTTYVNDLTAGNPAGSIAAIIPTYIGEILIALLGYIGDAILQGIITVEVARGTLGEKLPLSGLWARARGRIGVLIGWSFLVIAVAIVALGIWIGLLVVLFAFAGSAGAVIGGILIFLGVCAAIAAWIWIGTKISLVPSVLILERLTVWRAVRRSWRLTSGNFYFWRTFGIELLVSVMLSFAASIVASPFTIIVELIATVTNPVGLSSASGISSIFSATTITSAVIGALTMTITAIILTSTTALLYIDLRMRKEGLDLELMRFVDGRAAGATDIPDPYLPKAQPAP
jgi:hypothetical protein